MIPEKLEFLRTDYYKADKKDFTCKSGGTKELEEEIVRRYNGYADKDKLIEKWRGMFEKISSIRNLILPKGSLINESASKEVELLIDIFNGIDSALVAAKEKQTEEKFCGECGSKKVKTNWQLHKFRYGVEPNTVELSCEVPIRTCEDCGYNFMNYEGEDLMQIAIDKYLAAAKEKNGQQQTKTD